MRSYWLKILLGALGVFAVGMIGVTMVRSGIAKVSSVVEGDGPITIPLGLVPFFLQGERLGQLDRVTLNRERPNHVTDVELRIELADSLLAQGLAGCRLLADLEGGDRERGVDIRLGREGGERNAFRCLPADSIPEGVVEYGIAIFDPGEVEVPLYLPEDIVTELQTLDFGDHSASGDSLAGLAIPAESLAAEVERTLDSVMLRRQDAETRTTAARRFADSVRAEARKRLAEDADPQ